MLVMTPQILVNNLDAGAAHLSQLALLVCVRFAGGGPGVGGSKASYHGWQR